MIFFSILVHLFAHENTNRCNKFFCYSYIQAEKGWELSNLTNKLYFSLYGETHTEPLNLNPEFDDDQSPLISIDCEFSTPRFPLVLIIPSTVKYIKSRAFYRTSNISFNLEFDDEIIIGEGAFQDCLGLRNIYFNSRVKKISDRAFQDCTNLEYVSLIDAEEIGNFAFASCFNLTCNLKFGERLQILGNFAFAFCDHIYGDLTIPNSVTSLGVNVFQECSLLNGSLNV